ncbi:hypothetical protein B0H10DRAFT_1077202 [Mycena sp. CBHHK59/15]|nr:hypothetical protein B0H10DRAFT_1077202 [Mycena sp. CBHHK59/15]
MSGHGRYLDSKNDITSFADGASTDTLLDAATALPRQSSELQREVSWLRSSGPLRQFCFALHLLLVLVHIALVGIWSIHLEHRLVFSLENQSIASLLITAIATTVGAVYYSILVVVMQTLAMRRNLQTYRTLTATHDTAAAWAGIGSALFRLLSQSLVPASVLGSLCTFLYLGNIMVLHITTPALFSLETFNSSLSMPVKTQSLPEFNFSFSSGSPRLDIAVYGFSVLAFLPFIGNAPTLGLQGGTLYDVLEFNQGIGNTSVNATGFDISCGYLSGGINTQIVASLDGVQEPVWILDFPDLTPPLTFSLFSTQPGIMILTHPNETVDTRPINDQTIFLYSTIPIIDSMGNSASWVNLTSPMSQGLGVSALQLFQCSLSLISQTAIVDARSREMISVEPGIEKTSSRWSQSEMDINEVYNFTLYDIWGSFLFAMPPSMIYLDWTPTNTKLLLVGDQYLVQSLDLLDNARPTSLPLHKVENALSRLTASMYWILGHISPNHGNVNGSYSSAGRLPTITGWDITNRPSLLQGEAIVVQNFPETRLAVNIIAVVLGLLASMALTALALPFSVYYPHRGINDTHVPIGGSGFLHAIWLFRNQPELEVLLTQVEDPSETKLRRAGMVRTRLIGGRVKRY